MTLGGAPRVEVGVLAPDSLAPSIIALLRAGVARDPALAADVRGVVLLRFLGTDGRPAYPTARLTFGGETILVEDGDAGEDGADLVVTGRLPDVLALVSAPLAGGVPRPTHPRGRQALARLADGRVELEGPMRLGMRLVRLLRIEL